MANLGSNKPKDCTWQLMGQCRPVVFNMGKIAPKGRFYDLQDLGPISAS